MIPLQQRQMFVKKPRASRKRTTDRSAPQVAGLGRRVLAFLLDGICLFIIYRVALILLDAMRMDISTTLASLLLGFGYYSFFWELYDGQTPGKRWTGIRVVRADGQPITTTTTAIRYAGYYLNSFTLGLGWIAALFDSDRRGWHDRLAGTLVVMANPYPQTKKSALRHSSQ